MIQLEVFLKRDYPDGDPIVSMEAPAVPAIGEPFCINGVDHYVCKRVWQVNTGYEKTGSRGTKGQVLFCTLIVTTVKRL